MAMHGFLFRRLYLDMPFRIGEGRCQHSGHELLGVLKSVSNCFLMEWDSIHTKFKYNTLIHVLNLVERQTRISVEAQEKRKVHPLNVISIFVDGISLCEFDHNRCWFGIVSSSFSTLRSACPDTIHSEGIVFEARLLPGCAELLKRWVEDIVVQNPKEFPVRRVASCDV